MGYVLTIGGSSLQVLRLIRDNVLVVDFDGEPMDAVGSRWALMGDAIVPLSDDAGAALEVWALHTWVDRTTVRNSERWTERAIAVAEEHMTPGCHTFDFEGARKRRAEVRALEAKWV